MTSFDEEYHHSFDRRVGRFREQMTAERCSDLRRDGFVVIDNFLGKGWALALLQEMRWLNKKG